MSVPAFSQWLKQRRKALDLTQDELAQRVGCSLVLIQKLEAGQRRPSKQVAELLAERLAVPPDERPEFVRYARTRALQMDDHPSAPWRALRRQFANLPAGPTPVFGREQALEAIREQVLGQHARLLTLVGPPGIGKTRLGVAAAAQFAEDFEDGVFFVPLAAATQPDQVAAGIARALGLEDLAGQSPLERIQSFLADRRLLLVLDNLEQVVTAAPNVAELLAACPWLQLLATSRVPLHIRAERQFHVPPLELAPIAPSADVAGWLACPAVALFADRAQATQPEFVLTTENAPLVADICARLDGLPLAIELVAAHAGELGLPAMLAQLGHRLELLAGGPSDLPVRHQTLRNAIAWSYDRLAPPEQQLFACLSVFVGGCLLDGVAAACAPVSPAGLAEGLARLVDNNLLLRAAPERDEPRYAMLETIREYGLEQLEATGEGEAVRERHAAFMLSLAERAQPLHGEWLERLDREHDNFRAALRWLLDRGDSPAALRLSGALWRFWQRHGHLGEGLAWLDAALRPSPPAALDAAARLSRARALLGAGWLVRDLGDFARAQELFAQSLALYQELDDTSGLAYARYSAGYAEFLVGDTPAGIGAIEQSLALFRAANDQAGMAMVLQMLGRIAVAQGDYAQASAYLAECLQIEEGLGDAYGIARTLGSLGELAAYLGQYERAEQCLTESQALLAPLGERQFTTWVLTKRGEVAWLQGELTPAREFAEAALDLAREVGYQWNEAYALTYLGLITLAEGDAAQAQALCEQSLTLFGKLGSEGDVAQTRKDLARVCLAQGRPDEAAQLYQTCLGAFQARGYVPDVIECVEGLGLARAAQGNLAGAAWLLGAAHAGRAGLGLPLAPVFRASYERTVDALRARLGAAEFQRAWSSAQPARWDSLVASLLPRTGSDASGT